MRARRVLGLAAPLAAALICLAMLWLDIQQRQTLQRAQRSLGQVRQAQFDLAQGFLRALMPGQGAYSRAEGLALLQQAIRELRRERSMPGSELHLASRRFDQEASHFLQLLQRWPGDSLPPQPGLETELRVAYHPLELEARRIDQVYTEDFRQLTLHLERRYRLIMGFSIVLLTGLCLGVSLAQRREEQAVRALEQSEARLRAIGDNLPDSYVFQLEGVPPDLRFTHLSAGFERIHGLQHPSSVHQAQPWLEALGNHSQQPDDFEFEFSLSRPDGQLRRILVRCRPHSLGNGRLRWDGIASDVTELRHLNRVHALLSQTNQVIVRATQRLDLLQQACRIAVDSGGLSLAWVALRGDSPPHALEPLCCSHPEVPIEPVLAHCPLVVQALHDGQPAMCNDLESAPSPDWVSLARPLGQRSLAVFPLHLGEEPVGVLALHSHEVGFFGQAESELLEQMASDISFALTFLHAQQQRRHTEEQLKASEDRLRQAQKMEGIGQLAGGVAHDFNNILSVILMQTELLSLEPQLPEAVAEGLGVIRGASERAADLTRQLLLFSRRQVLQIRPLDLNEVVNNLVKLLHRIIGEDVRLQVQLHPQALPIEADSGMLGQVIMNLAVNGRDAMPEGGRLNISTSRVRPDPLSLLGVPQAMADCEYALLCVEDSGEGIPIEVQPHIFEPFFTTKALGKGTGLGLATVFGIVQQHQGWIEFQSQPGQGTSFCIYLPLQSGLVDQSASSPALMAGGKETLLLVEDDPDIRLLTRLTLEKFGYTVLEAEDGPSALRLWEQPEPPAVQLLFTDLVMPNGVSGMELARRLCQLCPDLRVVFTSGYQPDLAGRPLELQSGQAFLSKPYSPDQLLQAIRAVLPSPRQGAADAPPT